MAAVGYLTSWGPEERVAFTVFGAALIAGSVSMNVAGFALVVLSRQRRRAGRGLRFVK